MKPLIISLLFFVFAISSKAQNNYWQQEVNYTIQVSLTDNNHILHGYEEIEYINNSPDTLHFLYFHLYPNAYKNDKSAFTEQQVENKNTDFYYSKKNDKGFIDSLHFEINNQEVTTNNYNNHEDIIIIDLPNALLPKQKITITTPFRVVIPTVFSRLGHKGQAYYISQWYPKPAVYDKEGWHPMPYLDQGEFYSEYGSYDVRITLPKNYTVAATGDLQNKSEQDYIEQKIKHLDTIEKYKPLKNYDTIPLSAAELKTINFKQKNVHDFAWFADKRFLVEKTDTILEDGKKISCYSYYLPSHHSTYNKSSKTIAHTVGYLSKHVGNYPYSHASVVDGELEAGGGMEYPNVTVLGETKSKKILQSVIIHEVGHNWFYGLLGSNERDNAWMDEGINSFYEWKIDNYLNKKDSIPNHISNKKTEYISYQINAVQHNDQAIGEKSYEQTYINYGGDVYRKTQLALATLEEYLGEKQFETCMHKYFDTYKFKHPTPLDIKTIFTTTSNKNLDWFFTNLINEKDAIDYKVKSIRNTKDSTIVYIINKTKNNIPASVSACIEDSIIETKWIENNSTQVSFAKNNAITAYRINVQNTLPEVKWNNNIYYTKKLLHKHALAYSIFPNIGLKQKNTVHILPILGINYYDKVMLGVSINNINFPNGTWQYYINPLYSIKAKSIVGNAGIAYSIFPERKIQKIILGTKVQSYHNDMSDLNIKNPLYTRYIKINPFIQFEFKKPYYRSPIDNIIKAEWIHTREEDFSYSKLNADSVYKPAIENATGNNYATIQFLHSNARTINPYQFLCNTEISKLHAKISCEGNLKINYNIKNKNLYVRAFAGKFFDLKKTTNYFDIERYYLNATSSGATNYLYNDIYFGRNEIDGISAKQISMREGGFKLNTTKYINPIGKTDDWLLSLNVKTDIPINIPLVNPKIYFDVATFSNAKRELGSGSNSISELGVEFQASSILSIYVPIALSSDLKNYTRSVFSEKRLLNSISFSVTLRDKDIFNTQKIVLNAMKF